MYDGNHTALTLCSLTSLWSCVLSGNTTSEKLNWLQKIILIIKTAKNFAFTFDNETKSSNFLCFIYVETVWYNKKNRSVVLGDAQQQVGLSVVIIWLFAEKWLFKQADLTSLLL